MYTAVQWVHSILRYLVLFAGIWAVIRAFRGVAGKTPYTNADNKASLFYMIFFDLQVVFGLLLFFVSPLIGSALDNMGAAMKDSVLRFFTVEHTVLALASLAFMHIGRSKIKKAASDAQKHKTALIFFGISLILLLALIPWPFRAALGKGWLPGM
ncbi:hypothetical protein LX64_00623 [Chitinophaga skermanii]|uniref:Cytochrome b561 n=1 Tax=Chitinophaga skermanii TaxID=331697 RepID=A0A327R2H2_9BACT|nr:hypothetical protein [Chitinophaga skermanii]RAJ11016.1 hypothetical protein LX64_00623 [Chitinophaga skermanii]